MATNKTTPVKPGIQIKKLDFLVGNWHTKGKILHGSPASSNEIRGMDTYEWVAGGFFMLHRVDVFMGNERTEAIEIIGYDHARKCYFMKSFDSQGGDITMYAVLEKAGVLKFGDKKMRTVLRVNKKGNSMSAHWELSEDGKTWKPWMDIQLDK
jgi:hypothetical protein